MEADIPGLLRVGFDRLLPATGLVREDARAIHHAAGVVVAEDEEAFDLAPVRRLVVRKYAEPDVGGGLEFAREAAVRDVARHDHGVGTVVAEPFKRLLEGLRTVAALKRLAVLGEPNMDVADNAEAQQRLAG